MQGAAGFTWPQTSPPSSGVKKHVWHENDGTEGEITLNNGKTMDRRSFLGTLAAAAGMMVVGRRIAPADGAKLQSLSLCRCPIAGFQYYEGRALLQKLEPGQTLRLTRESTNPYDPLAIAVHTATNGKLGYLPRRLNEIPATLMDDGHRLTATIAAVSPDAPPWEVVQVEVRLGGKA